MPDSTSTFIPVPIIVEVGGTDNSIEEAVQIRKARRTGTCQDRIGLWRIEAWREEQEAAGRLRRSSLLAASSWSSCSWPLRPLVTSHPSLRALSVHGVRCVFVRQRLAPAG